MTPSCGVGGSEECLKKWVPLLVWLMVVCCLVAIPLKIGALGYLPTDDALRHAAKIVSGKAWADIIILRPEMTIDLHPGWHAFLGLAHRFMGIQLDGLVMLEVSVAFLLLCFVPLLWLRRPEAWVLALLVTVVSYAGFIGRVMLGRPFIIPMAVLAALLFLWRDDRMHPLWRYTLSVMLVGLATCIHGSWYLLGIVPAAVLLTGAWRRAFRLALCWLLGAVLGGAFVGQPLEFPRQQLMHMLNVMGHATLQRMLVPELQPSEGAFPFLVVVALLLLWIRLVRGRWDTSTFRNPAFAVGVLGWVLSLAVIRFWVDWGLIAMMVWMAQELERILSESLPTGAPQRLLLCALACAALYFGTTSDLQARWTKSLSIEYLDASEPRLAEWMPGERGTLYSGEMAVFFRTFYKNPHASWRYILGFETGLMPEEDLEILRTLQLTYGDPRAYEPWVRRMKPEDRLVIMDPPGRKPRIPELEWFYAVRDTWIGRLPRDAAAGR